MNRACISPRKCERRNPTRLSALTVLCAVGWWASAWADTGNASTDTSSTTATGDSLQEVIVSARKHDERLEDVPAAITDISAASLLENHEVSLEDYYATVPGLSIVSMGNGQTAIIMRGLSTGVQGNPTVGVTIDDVPIGATETAIINGAAYVPELDPADLQSIEFLKGPQGTLYGASSIGGVLRYVTAAPDLKSISGHVQVDDTTIPGGGDGFGVRGSVNVPVIADTLAVRISGFGRQDPGYVNDPSHGEKDVNGANVFGGHLDALYQATQNFSVRLTALIQRTEGFGDSGVDTNYLYQPSSDLNQSRLLGTGAYSLETQLYSAVLKYHTDLFDIASITAYSDFRPDQNIDLTPTVGGASVAIFDVGGASETYTNSNSKFSQEVRFTSAAASKLGWEFGGFYTHENNASGLGRYWANDLTTGAVAGQLLNYYFTSTYEEYAGFGNLTYHFTDQFDVLVGGRESHNTQNYYQDVSGPLVGPAATLSTQSSDSSFTYLVTPRFRISDSVMAYASISSGYEPGGPNTPATPSPTIPVTFAPSTTVNYELGVKSRLLQERLSIDADIFYVDWSKVQLTGVTPVLETTYTFNGGKAKSEGVELATDFKPVEGLTLSLTFAYIDAMLINTAGNGFPGVAGNQLPFSSKLSGSFSAQERFRISGSVDGFVGATAAYVGKRDEGFPVNPGQAQPSIPSYGYGDVRTGIETNGFTVTAFVKNVTNERGILQSTQLTGATATSGLWHTIFITPRLMGLSVAKSF